MAALIQIMFGIEVATSHYLNQRGSWLIHASLGLNELTHWGRVTHICVSKLTIIASDNGLSPGRRQAIIWNNAGIFSIGLLGTNFSEIVIKIHTFSFKKMHLKTPSGKWRPSCLYLNVLKQYLTYIHQILVMHIYKWTRLGLVQIMAGLLVDIFGEFPGLAGCQFPWAIVSQSQYDDT